IRCGFFSLSICSPPLFPPFPYTTLFRSLRARGGAPGTTRRPTLRALQLLHLVVALRRRSKHRRDVAPGRVARVRPESRALAPHRSEEHTSELQSRSDLVCRLLLEKKKSA